MSLRRVGTLVAALALTACHSVTQEAQPAELVFASYNSATGAIPLPNDLLLQIYTPASARPSATVSQAQIEVLRGYARSGGFPSDVEAAITIPFNAITWNGTAYVAAPLPTLDAGTVTPQTVVLLRWDNRTLPAGATPTTTPAAPEVVAYEAVVSAGKLTLRPPQASDTDKARRWKGGRYVVAVRGGASGVKTSTGAIVNADSGVALAIQNKDMSIKENQPPGFTAAQAAQVNGLRAALWNAFDWKADATGAWTPAPSDRVAPAFQAVDAFFPYGETAVVSTFSVDNSPHVTLDSGAGQVPFPSDFMLETKAASEAYPQGCLVTQGAPLPCVKYLPDSFGAAADGLRFLDGFSTTALLLAPLTGDVDASTVTWNNVHVFELTAGLPVRLKDLASTLGAGGAGAAYVTQPTGTTRDATFVDGSTGKAASTLVLAPAVHADLSALGAGKHNLPPLKPRTRYVVLVTNRVKDLAGNAMTRGAVANILLSTAAPLAGPGPGGGNISYVQGADYETALGLQQIRDGLAPLFANLGALTGGATTKNDVAMVYTVTTQSVTGTSVGLSALPYSALAAAPGPTVTTLATPAEWEAGTGFPAAGLPGIQHVVAGKVSSINPILASTGTLNPSQAAWAPTQLDYLATVPTLAAGCTPATPCAVPVVVFHHGLSGSRYQMLPLAASLAAAGMVAVAIDAPYHGDRAFCKVDSDCTTGAADGVCTPTAGNQEAPATCTTGVLKFDAAGLKTVAGGNYFVSGNFFRTRDAIRRDLLDQSALVLGVAPPAPRATDEFAAALLADGVAVDPTKVYYVGQSLGAIIGTSVLATNPRFGRAVLNVGGGTLVDVFTTSPAFTGQPSGPGSSELEKALQDVIPGFTLQAAATNPALGTKYNQLLQVAKWILDPADPINYAGAVKTKLASPLLAAPPGGLGGTGLVSSTTAVLAQMAQGDTVVPNPTNLELAGLIGTTPALYQTTGGGAVSHGYLISAGPGNVMQTGAAAFLFDGTTVPASPVTVP